MPRLRLKWAFGFPAGVSANAEPSIVAGRVFVGSDNGFFYSLNAASGCVYWSFEVGSTVRGAATLAPIKTHAASRYAVYFGDGRANVYALDARSGALLWKSRVDEHFVARITAGPRFYDGKLLVPVSSSEGFSAGTPGLSLLHGSRQRGGTRGSNGATDLEGVGDRRGTETLRDAA